MTVDCNRTSRHNAHQRSTEHKAARLASFNSGAIRAYPGYAEPPAQPLDLTHVRPVSLEMYGK
eukprot:CAMPEP_0182836266 /NCGR_PEP_ID=MMETSP0006_2-20121128/21998_1 /TAXON_ID=97485 /ORGANISM="Prymnesium parvum, Strain Texoma1" /LENGTH=62 /DNA_ID=CAMNT_0024964851 /DNA_START=189 /DNA_END=377 /DNA_ORIENTATION=-